MHRNFSRDEHLCCTATRVTPNFFPIDLPCDDKPRQYFVHLDLKTFSEQEQADVLAIRIKYHSIQ